MIKILFVCHGNICRSPMAEYILKDMVKKQGLEGKFCIDSAATSSEEIGNPVHPGTRERLRQCGISTEGKVARQITKRDYNDYDYLIGMDSYNVKNMQRIFREDGQGKICRLLDFTPELRDIADPWYTGDFETTYQDIKKGCEYLLNTVMHRKKKAVIFDMDGVLIDSERIVLRSWHEIANKYGFDDVEAVCRKCLGTNYETTKGIFLSAYSENFPYDDYKKEMSALFHKIVKEEGMPLKPGVFELLAYLKQNGFQIGLASSTRKEVVVSEMDMIGALPYFKVVMGGDMVKKGKPEPEIYLMACEALQVDPAEAYAIEDSYNGIRSAYRAGMSPIMVPDLVGPNEEMEDLSEVILPSLFAVKDYLAQWTVSRGIKG